MKGLVLVLTLALVASQIAPLYGLAMETLVVHLARCKCLVNNTVYLNIHWIQSIEVTQGSILCRRTEVIITLRNGKRLCVPPKAKWVENLIKKVTKRTKK